MTTRPWGLPVLWVAVAMSTGCADGPDGVWPVVENERSDDIPILTASVVLKIGSVSGEGPYVFGDIGAFAVVPTAKIYILDYHAQEIRAFSPTGEYLFAFGREGQGPGELLGGAGLAFGPDGHLWAWDFRNARFSEYEQDGAFVSSIRRPATGTIFGWRGGFAADEWLYDFGVTFIDLREGRPLGTGTEIRPYRYSIVDERWEQLPPLRGDHELNDEGVPRPRAGQLVVALAPNGDLVVGHQARYQIWRVAPSGDTVLEIRLDQADLPIPGDQLDSVIGLPWGPVGTPIRPEDLPAHRTPFRRMFFADDGRMFVAATDLDDRGLKDRVYDVFSSDGRLVHRVITEVPLGSAPMPRVRGDTITAISRDEFDLEYLVRLVIDRPFSDGDL